MSSARSMLRMARSCVAAGVGARVKPQLPMTHVVTPCKDAQLPSGSQKIWASKWVCPSMKPGVTNRPEASTSSSARSGMAPIVATRPAATATSARNGGLPVPSTTVPPRMTRSYIRAPPLVEVDLNVTKIEMREGRRIILFIVTPAFSFRSGGVAGMDRPRRLSQPRIAEMIADSLRRRILEGELADGDVLPKVDDLLLEFPVSKPSIREAMRILETEGLISVRRGNVGGAVIHSPKPKTAAYMLGMVLQADHVALADLAQALSEFEPACAIKAAESPERVSRLVPLLVGLNDELEAQLDDGPAFTLLARRFHDAVVSGCGNQTMAIEAGDGARTGRLVARHLHESQRYVLAGGRRQLITVEGLSKAPW